MQYPESQISRRYSSREGDAYRHLVEALREGVIPDEAILAQLALFQPRVALSHTLFMNELYQQILTVPGSVAEFGVQWGRNLATFHGLRGIYEPNNFSRHILGFDTFAGFPGVSDRDGSDPETRIGGLAVTPGWEDNLARLLEAHQSLSIRPDHKRFQLLKGDVSETLPAFLEANPHTLISLAYIDLDLYEPSRDVIKAIWSLVPRGGIIAFDEINLDLFPGETHALLECIDLNQHRLVRSPYANYQAYCIK